MPVSEDMYDGEAWAWVARGAGYEPIHTESAARYAFMVAAEILELLTEAEQHLEYCGYGDNWERECADASKLPERLSTVIAKYSKPA